MFAKGTTAQRRSPNRAKPRQLEAREQTAFFNWVHGICRFNHKKEYEALKSFYAIPNGGARSAKTGAMLKGMGVRRGVPDMHLPVARGCYHSLYIEFKEPEYKRKPDSEQLAVIDELRSNNNCVAVCYSWEEAMKLSLLYASLDKGEVIHSTSHDMGVI